MTEPECVFCKIVAKQLSADVLQESDNAITIRNINPKAPVHYLVIPKRHIVSIKDIRGVDDEALLGHMIGMAKEAAVKLGLAGYKLAFNVGREGGQVVDHIHLHLLGGWE